MRATAKNIQAGTVEVEVIAVYSETAYEVFVPKMGGKAIVQKKDLTFENEEERKALELIYILKNDYIGVNPTIEGWAGQDLQIMFVNSYSNKGAEVVTIWVHAGYYEVETNLVDECGGAVEESQNVRKIVKLETLVKWLEKRIG